RLRLARERSRAEKCDRATYRARGSRDAAVPEEPPVRIGRSPGRSYRSDPRRGAPISDRQRQNPRSVRGALRAEGTRPARRQRHPRRPRVGHWAALLSNDPEPAQGLATEASGFRFGSDLYLVRSELRTDLARLRPWGPFGRATLFVAWPSRAGRST